MLKADSNMIWEQRLRYVSLKCDQINCYYERLMFLEK